MATATQKTTHVIALRTAATTLMDTIKVLQGLKLDWTYLGLSTDLVQGDLTGTNDGMTPTDISGVYTTLAAFETTLAAGHGTNLTKVKL